MRKLRALSPQGFTLSGQVCAPLACLEILLGIQPTGEDVPSGEPGVFHFLMSEYLERFAAVFNTVTAFLSGGMLNELPRGAPLRKDARKLRAHMVDK